MRAATASSTGPKIPLAMASSRPATQARSPEQLPPPGEDVVLRAGLGVHVAGARLAGQDADALGERGLRVEVEPGVGRARRACRGRR